MITLTKKWPLLELSETHPISESRKVNLHTSASASASSLQVWEGSFKVLNLWEILNLSQKVKRLISRFLLLQSQNILQTSKLGSIGAHFFKIARPSKSCRRSKDFRKIYLPRFPQILQKAWWIRSKNQVLNRLPGAYMKLKIQIVNGYATINSEPRDY